MSLNKVKEAAQPKPALGIVSCVWAMENRYTLGEAAKMIGKDRRTILRWGSEYGVKLNSDSKMFGKVPVRLFTPDDIDRLRRVALNRDMTGASKGGRKKRAS